jgi:hypothetical protein
MQKDIHTKDEEDKIANKGNDHLVKSEAWLNAARIWFARHENTRRKDSSEWQTLIGRKTGLG